MSNINYVNSDSIEYMKTLKDNSIDLILCDPPYGINFHGKYDPHTGWDNFSKDEFSDFNKEWLTQAYRILKENGTMWMFCGPTQIPSLFKTISEVGFKNNLNNWKSIQRQKGKGAKIKPKSLREDILHLTKSDNYTWNNTCSDVFNLSEGITNVVDLSVGKVIRPLFSANDKVFYFRMPYYLSKTEKMIHSCQKSILLQSLLILNSTNKDETVLDCFMGSGSSGIASYICNRNYIGIERDESMYKTASKWKDTFNRDSYINQFLTLKGKGLVNG